MKNTKSYTYLLLRIFNRIVQRSKHYFKKKMQFLYRNTKESEFEIKTNSNVNKLESEVNKLKSEVNKLKSEVNKLKSENLALEKRYKSENLALEKRSKDNEDMIKIIFSKTRNVLDNENLKDSNIPSSFEEELFPLDWLEKEGGKRNFCGEELVDKIMKGICQERTGKWYQKLVDHRYLKDWFNDNDKGKKYSLLLIQKLSEKNLKFGQFFFKILSKKWQLNFTKEESFLIDILKININLLDYIMKCMELSSDFLFVAHNAMDPNAETAKKYISSYYTSMDFNKEKGVLDNVVRDTLKNMVDTVVVNDTVVNDTTVNDAVVNDNVSGDDVGFNEHLVFQNETKKRKVQNANDLPSKIQKTNYQHTKDDLFEDSKSIQFENREIDI